MGGKIIITGIFFITVLLAVVSMAALGVMVIRAALDMLDGM